MLKQFDPKKFIDREFEQELFEELLAFPQELLQSDASPQEFTRRLFAINVAQARASDPLLAEIMPKCAIPPSFDAAVIGVLRDAPADQATNERLLSQLVPYNYVQQDDRSGFGPMPHAIQYRKGAHGVLLSDFRRIWRPWYRIEWVAACGRQVHRRLGMFQSVCIG